MDYEYSKTVDDYTDDRNTQKYTKLTHNRKY